MKRTLDPRMPAVADAPEAGTLPVVARERRMRDPRPGLEPSGLRPGGDPPRARPETPRLSTTSRA